MKPTQIQELFANIKATIVSFFSIMMFVALGVGIFAGIYWMAPALQTAANKAYDEGAFHHFQIQFPYGLTDADLKELSAVEGVDAVEPMRQSFQGVRTGSKSLVVKVQSAPQEIDALQVIEGSLPADGSQIVVNERLATALDAGIGDTVVFEADAKTDETDAAQSANETADEVSVAQEGDAQNAADGGDSSNEAKTDESPKAQSVMRYLNQQEYTLVGVVKSPEYLACEPATYGLSPRGSGLIDGIAWVGPGAFNAQAFDDGWPVVNVRCSSLEGMNSFSSSYVDASAPIQTRIVDLGDVLGDNRFQVLHDEAQAKIDDGEAKLAEARTKIATGEKELAKAKRKIKETQAKIKEGEAELKKGKKEIKAGETKLAEGRAQFEQKTNAALKQLNAAKEKLDKASEQYQAGAQALAEAKAADEAIRKAYTDARANYGNVQSQMSALKSTSDRLGNAVAKGTTTERDYWIAVYPLYRAFKTTCETSNSSIGSLNNAIGEAAKKYPDANITGAIPLLSTLPNLSSVMTKAEYASTKAAVDSSISAIQADLGSIRTAPVTIAGTSYNFDTAASLQPIASDVITKAQNELDSKKKIIDENTATYNKAVSEYNKETESAQAKLDEADAQLTALKQKAEQGERDLEEARARVKEGKQQVKEKTAELEDGKVELQKKTDELDEAKRQLGLMKDYGWTVAPRSYNGGSIEVETFSGITNRLSFSMAALFIIVGLLVSYSAISRIVHEQITQIGTKKALGLRSREITVSFLLYAAIAVLVGSVVGLVVGTFVVEGIIASVLGQQFEFEGLPPYFDIGLALVVTGIELVLVCGSAWLACRSILREHAVELLKGEKPPEGKTRFFEKWALWDKLPLFTQTIINNCFNDKRRVFSTIVGVAGCTALVITAFTLNDDVLASFDKQYSEVYGFDTIAFVDDEVEGSADAVQNALAAEGYSAAQVYRQSQVLQLPDGGRAPVKLIVPADDQAFSAMYHLNSTTGDVVDLSVDGAWITEAYASHIGAKVGDTLVMNGTDGAVYELPIAGFYRFYLPSNEMVLGKGAYERLIGTSYKTNALLANLGGASVADVEEELVEISGFDQLYDDKTRQHKGFESFSKVSSVVVLVYLALSVLMAIVVLLNLNMMFVDEKKRELIVLMINGFSAKDAKRYVYNDTIVLTVLGILVGIVLGAIMGTLTVGSMEPNTTSFYKGIDGFAIAIAAALSVALSTVMSVIALRRIPRFNLTDINRF